MKVTELNHKFAKFQVHIIKPSVDFYISIAYLALSVTGVMHRVRIETFKLVWREEDAPLMAFDLCKEVLLLVVMCRCHIAYGERILIENVMCGKH